jgi:hypothetical protein
MTSRAIFLDTDSTLNGYNANIINQLVTVEYYYDDCGTAKLQFGKIFHVHVRGVEQCSF